MMYESRNQKKFREENLVDLKTMAYGLATVLSMGMIAYVIHGCIKNPDVFTNDNTFTNRLERITK